MPKGLTELIEHVLEQIALCGEHGKSLHWNHFLHPGQREKLGATAFAIFFHVISECEVLVECKRTELTDNGVFIRLKANSIL